MDQEQQLTAPRSPRTGQKRLLNGNVARGAGQGASGTQTPSLVATPEGGRTRQTFDADASIVLVGIRGCGKRSLGFIAATALGRRFITEDYYFQQTTGVSRQDYLKTHGSEQFHKEDVEVSRRMLAENRTGCVIDCGLGSLTSSLQEYLKAYSATNPVIHIVRDIQAVKELLKLTDRAAKMLENADPSHRRCSNFEFFNLEDDSSPQDASTVATDRDSPIYAFKLQQAQTDFSSYVKGITSTKPQVSHSNPLSLDNAIDTRLYTHALQMPLSAFETATWKIKDLEGSGDVVEVIVERWNHATANSLSRLVAAVRRSLRMPVMVTPAFVSSSLPVNDYFAILRHALRLNVEFVAINLRLEGIWLNDYISRCRTSRVVGIYLQDASAESAWKESSLSAICDKAIALGVNMLRLTAKNSSRLDNERLESITNGLRQKYAAKLSISAFNLELSGRATQLLNHTLTPVTHNLLGQLSPATTQPPTAYMTSNEAFQALFASFALDPLHFYVLGANVSSSLSPAMHNTAYKRIGLPHEYSPVNVSKWADIEKIITSLDFGGASIAQPWKVKITDKISCLSEHAKAIGAINTLIPLRGEAKDDEALVNDQALYRNRSGPVQTWFGENTDWISIRDCLSRNISPRNTIQAKTTALIVGAGGMARSATYALLRLGCQNIFVYNRTVAHAEKMIEHFQAWLASQSDYKQVHMQVLRSSDEPWPAGFTQPTIIVSGVTAEKIPGEDSVATFTTPTQWLASATGGTAVEQAYYIETPFVKSLKEYRTRSNALWNIVDGLEVLHTQGAIQFEIMTNKRAPRAAMWEAVRAAAGR